MKDRKNLKAAAIECYLDLTYTVNEPPTVRWISYNQKLDCYQGELIQKARHAKRFLQLRAVKEDYDFSGLNAVLDAIGDECLLISSDEEGRIHLLLQLAIGEENQNRWCLWRPDQVDFDARSIFEGALVKEQRKSELWPRPQRFA